MAAYLLDTNVVLRLADRADAEHSQALDAVARLLLRGDEPVITAQVLIECWAVASRPRSNNGLAWDGPRIENAQIELLRDFRLLEETGNIFPQWRSLVRDHDVRGKQVHDARLAAVVLCHGHRHILTFNPSDFVRFSGLNVVHPKDVALRAP